MKKQGKIMDNPIADYGATINGESLDGAQAQLIDYINGMELDPARYNGLLEAIGRYSAALERAVVMTCVDRLTSMFDGQELASKPSFEQQVAHFFDFCAMLGSSAKSL